MHRRQRTPWWLAAAWLVSLAFLCPPVTAQPAASVSNPVPSGPAHGVRIAVVIDDLGHDVAELRPLEGLGVPVTYSVLAPTGGGSPGSLWVSGSDFHS